MINVSLLAAISITEKRLKAAMDIDNMPAIELHEALLGELKTRLKLYEMEGKTA